MRRTVKIEDAAEHIWVHFIQTIGTITAIHETRAYTRAYKRNLASLLIVEDCLRWSNDQEPIYGVVDNTHEPIEKGGE